jgi:hypothetical protein
MCRFGLMPAGKHELLMRPRFISNFVALGTSLLVVLSAFSAAAKEFADPVLRLNVRDFGARGNGARLETGRIQNAIDACARQGGGLVVFPAGQYCSGTLFLKSGVVLHLEEGALLTASRDLANYPRVSPGFRSYTDNYTERSLIYGEELQDIGIEGEGTIDGNGEAFFGSQLERPYLIRFVSCHGVSVKGITLRDAAMWAQHYLACDEVRIEDITVHNRCRMNNDGLDLDGCHRVRIARCDISSEDDSIVLKSTSNRGCRDVEISQCRLSSDNNALKLGTESSGGFENIRITDCAIYNTKCSGLALEVVDGGLLDGVDVSHLVMRDVASPIFIRLGNRARRQAAGAPKPAIGSLRNVRIRDVVATGADRIGCSITGLPGYPAKNISLEDIRVTFAGGSQRSRNGQLVSEHASKYPEYSMFGSLPAYGFYCRHVEDLRFAKIELDFQKPDARPSLVCDDVAGLQLSHWIGQGLTEKARPFRLLDVNDAQLDNVSLRLDDARSKRATGKHSKPEQASVLPRQLVEALADDSAQTVLD